MIGQRKNSPQKSWISFYSFTCLRASKFAQWKTSFYFLLNIQLQLNILLTYDVIDVNECFHDFMFVNRALPPAPPTPVNLVLQHWCKALQSLCCTIRRLFVAYSRTIRRLFADYSYYSRTIRRLFVDYSLHYSSFINCRPQSIVLFVFEAAGHSSHMAQASRKRITDGTRKTLGVSSPCLLDCLCSQRGASCEDWKSAFRRLSSAFALYHATNANVFKHKPIFLSIKRAALPLRLLAAGNRPVGCPPNSDILMKTVKSFAS